MEHFVRRRFRGQDNKDRYSLMQKQSDSVPDVSKRLLDLKRHHSEDSYGRRGKRTVIDVDRGVDYSRTSGSRVRSRRGLDRRGYEMVGRRYRRSGLSPPVSAVHPVHRRTQLVNTVQWMVRSVELTGPALRFQHCPC